MLYECTPTVNLASPIVWIMVLQIGKISGTIAKILKNDMMGNGLTDLLCNIVSLLSWSALSLHSATVGTSLVVVGRANAHHVSQTKSCR